MPAKVVHQKAQRRYTFSGHETFPFRYAWLPKGVQGVNRNPRLFSSEDAMVSLGVGRNMVSSIRHWSTTLGLIEPTDRGQRARPTRLGAALFGREGWDPYLEDPATLWLLHWLLVRRPEPASTWHFAFTQFNLDVFGPKDLVNWLLRLVAQSPYVRATPASLKRDVDVFLRTYTPSHGRASGLPSEDTFDCPLVELGLLRELERGVYRFVRGQKPSLAPVIFIYALRDFWELRAPVQRSLTFEEILHGEGSPGGAFKLSENALVERLEGLPRWSRMTYDETAGRRQVFRLGKRPEVDGLAVLRHHYGEISERART